MKKLNEIMLKEDVNSFIEWGNNYVETNKNKINKNVFKLISRNVNEFNNFLNELYNLTINVDEINSKYALLLFLEQSHTFRTLSSFNQFIYYIEKYIYLMTLSPKRYSIDIKRINKNKQIKSVYKLKEYITDSLTKISKLSKRKKERSGDESDDVFIYEDKKFKITLFTNHESVKARFEGISNWCISKSDFYWNMYVNSGVLVLFVDKLEKDDNLKYVCNEYKIEEDNKINLKSSSKLDGGFLKIPNKTSNYQDIVEDKLLEITNNDFNGLSNIVEGFDNNFGGLVYMDFVRKTENGTNLNIRDSVNINNIIFDFDMDAFLDFDDDVVIRTNLEEFPATEDFKKAKFYGGLNIYNVELDKPSRDGYKVENFGFFPPIKFVESELFLNKFSANIIINKNDLDNIELNDSFCGIHFEDDLKLFDFSSNYSSVEISAEGSMEIENISIDNDGEVISNLMIEGSHLFFRLDEGKHGFELYGSDTCSLILNKSLKNITFFNFRDIYLGIDNEGVLKDTKEIKFAKNVKNVVILIQDDLDEDDLKKIIDSDSRTNIMFERI